MVHESGPLSIWLQRGLERLDQMRLVLMPAKRTKHDQRALTNRMPLMPKVWHTLRAYHAVVAMHCRQTITDNRGETGCFSRVHLRSDVAEGLRALVRASEWLIRLRKDIEGHVRGVVKVFGIRMTGVYKGQQCQC